MILTPDHLHHISAYINAVSYSYAAFYKLRRKKRASSKLAQKRTYMSHFYVAPRLRSFFKIGFKGQYWLIFFQMRNMPSIFSTIRLQLLFGEARVLDYLRPVASINIKYLITNKLSYHLALVKLVGLNVLRAIYKAFKRRVQFWLCPSNFCRFLPCHYFSAPLRLDAYYKLIHLFPCH